MYVKCNIVARSRNHCGRAKAISITYSECVTVALGTQLAKRMHRIVLSTVACPVLPFFPHLTQKRKFLHRKLLNIKCVI